jgi:hypothetical protein
MPNPSELERQAQEAVYPEQPPMSLVRLFAWRVGQAHYQIGERIAVWIAWRLPKRIVLWAMIRVAAHATTGRWGSQSPGNLTYAQMHDRWGIDNG